METITKQHAILSDIDLSLLPSTSTDIEPWQQELIVSLEQKLGGAVAMITGRGMDSVDKVFPGIAASVEQHAAWRPERGAQLQALAAQMDVDRLADQAVKELSARLHVIKELADIAGDQNEIYVERKQFSLALIFSHNACQNTKDVAHDVAHHLLAMQRDLQEIDKEAHDIKNGSDSVEIGPKGVHKGIAIKDFMNTASFKGKIPIYIGDGPTDEDAMREVRLMGGFNVAVGTLITDESLVDLRVANIEQAWDVLKKWDAGLAP